MCLFGRKEQVYHQVSHNQTSITTDSQAGPSSDAEVSPFIST